MSRVLGLEEPHKLGARGFSLERRQQRGALEANGIAAP